MNRIHSLAFADGPTVVFVPNLPPMNTGDDVAGYVHTVGAGVTEFKPGDRVGAFHEMMTPHGSFAEYAIAWAKTTFHIPAETTFEEAATIPLAAMTAVVGLVCRLSFIMSLCIRPSQFIFPLRNPL